MADLPVSQDLVGKTVWVTPYAGARRQRLLVDRVDDLGSDLFVLIGRLARKPGGAYAPTDTRGFGSALVRADETFEEVS